MRIVSRRSSLGNVKHSMWKINMGKFLRNKTFLYSTADHFSFTFRYRRLQWSGIYWNGMSAKTFPTANKKAEEQTRGPVWWCRKCQYYRSRGWNRMTLKLNQRRERQRLSINYGFLSSRRCHYHVAKSHKLVIKPSAVDASQQLSSSLLASAETTTIMHSNALERDFLFSRAIFSFGVEHWNAISWESFKTHSKASPRGISSSSATGFPTTQPSLLSSWILNEPYSVSWYS